MAAITIHSDTVPLMTPSNVFVRGTEEFDIKNDQYAYSTYGRARMDPSVIVYALNKKDIIGTIQYAINKGIAVAIRTGGHQYSGASSTTGKNILLDLSQTFKDDGVDMTYNKEKCTVRTSVSYPLSEFNAFLQKNRVFVPHGQCATVHLGGHVQTGGYGQLGRSFGLFGDHVIELEIVDHTATPRTITKASDPALFKAILGGSPGNFCVITHFTITVHRDRDYRGSIGLKCMWLYDNAVLQRLLTMLAKMSDNLETAQNYDFCINVISSNADLPSYFPGIDDDKAVKDKLPENFGKGKHAANPVWPAFISVYAQWVPFKGSMECDFQWFKDLEEGSLYAQADTTNSNPPWAVKSMSELSSDWLFPRAREFEYPYVKSTRVTSATDLIARKWPEWVAGRIHEIIGTKGNGCYLAVQIQNFGGENSMFYQNRNNGTGYSWRDSTMVVTLDCFYAPSAPNNIVPKDIAKAWFQVNEKEAVTQLGSLVKGKFTDKDKRVLWGSFGEAFDLDLEWEKYYDNEKMYRDLCTEREKADPNRLFTPNKFSVAYRGPK